MAKRRMGIILFLFCFCLCLIPGYAQAASTADAAEPIVTANSCTLTLAYSCDGKILPSVSVTLHRVADVSADFQYALVSDFQNSGVQLNGVGSASQWNDIRTTLESHILAEQIAPEWAGVTDADGQIRFDSLKPGLYLAAAAAASLDDTRCVFDSALIALPGLGEDGLWQYEVKVSPKPQLIPPTEAQIQWKVLKLWKGDENKASRPESIEVEIFRDGISTQIVTLSEENHWGYSWTTEDDGARWMAVERNIPEGYTVAVEERGSTFVLINTMETEEIPSTDTPKTGDTHNLMLYLILMFVSGFMMILLGLSLKRKRL